MRPYFASTPSVAYFILKLDTRGRVVASDIYSEPSPTVAGDYRYSRPILTVTRGTFDKARARVVQILQSEARQPTKLGRLVRQLDRSGALPNGVTDHVRLHGLPPAANKHALVTMQLVKRIRCETCVNYAWSFDRMKPVMTASGELHHPSCATLPGNTPAERAARLRASIGTVVTATAVR